MENFIINYFIIAIVTIYGVSSMIVGDPAAEGQFKYIVSIQQQDNEHHCSGIIIDEMHIITAAHAVDGIPPSSLSVVAGKVMLLFPLSETIPVQWVHIHFGFKRIETNLWPYENSWNNDIAVLQLSRKFIWGPNIGPAPLLNRAMPVDSCDSCIMPGWNYNVLHSKKSVNLHWNSVYREHNIDERGKPINLAVHQQCIGDLHQLSIIKNENVGSPIVCDNYVVGFIVKGGEKTNRPSIFLEIFPHSEFIFDVINDFNVDAREGQFPYSVTLWHFGEYLCSGIIYDARHVITAAHAMRNIHKHFLNVIAGRILVEESDYVQSGILVQDIATPAALENNIRGNSVAKVIRNNIVILTLSRPIAPEFVDQLQFGKNFDAPADQVCRVLRWFREYDGVEVVRKLKTSPAILLTRTVCRKMGAKLRGEQFCAVNPYSKILAEKEDIGNPIVCKGKVVGIVLYLVPDVSDRSYVPVVFVNVNRYRFLDGSLTENIIDEEYDE